MKRSVLALVPAILLIACQPLQGASASRVRLPTGRDAYLMEDDFVYARFLELAHGGTYRQINRDGNGSAEVDRGTWEQDDVGILRLHSTCHALRPRALLSGPLSVVITSQSQRAALPLLLSAVRTFLARTSDTVFDAGAAAEAGGRNGEGIEVERNAATFSRKDLDALGAQMAEALQTEQSGTYVLTPVTGSSPSAFVLQGTVFQAGDLANVLRDYKVARDGAAPFYFALVHARTFAREAGRWQPLHLPGEAE